MFINESAERVQAFLDERAKMKGLDPQEIHGASGAPLLVDDLKELLRIASDHETCQADMWSGVYDG